MAETYIGKYFNSYEYKKDLESLSNTEIINAEKLNILKNRGVKIKSNTDNLLIVIKNGNVYEITKDTLIWTKIGSNVFKQGWKSFTKEINRG